MRRIFQFRLRHQVSLTALLSLAAASGCTGIVSDDLTSHPNGSAGVASGTQTTGVGGLGSASGGAGSVAGNAGTSVDGGGSTQASACVGQPVAPTSAPIRRLTRAEFNGTVAALLFDTTSPAVNLPPETFSNGFGNDALQQSPSADLVSGYSDVASDVATRATQTATLAKLAPCASSATTTTAQDTCAKSFIQDWVAKAYRRPLVAGEADGLLSLEQSISATDGFASGIAAVIEAVLQSANFLYRPEFGVADPTNPALRRPTNDEMATRLSYLYWGAPPDDALRMAASNGQLLTAEGIMAQAKRLLADDRAHGVVKFFFDNLLPITTLTDQTRSTVRYPGFSPTIGNLMRQETEKFLDNQIFAENGTWPSVFLANYTFVNDALAKFYGMPPVTGSAFQKVQLDPTQRRGLLTQGAIMTGTTVTNSTNPVLRGSFILNKMMCMNIALPSDPAILAQVKIPDDVTGDTARERFTAHSKQAICQGCHHLIDPVGFALENYDAVGQYRTTEVKYDANFMPINAGVPIDASGKLPDGATTVVGAVQLAQQLADSSSTQNCFAQHWIEYAYARTLQSNAEDRCLQEKVNTAFKASGYNVKQLLLDLTQTSAFQYLPAQE